MEFTKLLEDFQYQLEVISAKRFDILKEANLSLVVCRDYFSKLRELAMSRSFENLRSEIYFFKHIKPQIAGELIFFETIRSIELEMPKGETGEKKKKILKHVKAIDIFLLEQKEFSQYMAMKHEDLDAYYFTRNPRNKIIPKNNLLYYADPCFNTSHDWILSKILAHNKLLDYLRKRLFLIEEEIENGFAFTNQVQKLKWTASKSAIVELIYALRFSNSIDNGKTGIDQIAKTFQTIFDIEIGNIYNVFSEIKIRQKSKTKFLDELTFDLRREIEKSER